MSKSTAFCFIFLIGTALIVEGGKEVDLDPEEEVPERSARKRRFDSESFERHVFGRELTSVERRYGGILGMGGGGFGGGGAPWGAPPPYRRNPWRFRNRWNGWNYGNYGSGCCNYNYGYYNGYNGGYRERYNYQLDRWGNWGKK